MIEWTDIGEQLRKTRESKGLDLKDVTHTTRIPLSTLTALEESDYSIFPSPSYARSFLSQYSEFLEIDANEWLDAFETGDVLSNINDHAYLQSHNEHLGSHRHNPEPARRRGRNAGRYENSALEKSSGGSTSILQTLTVFSVTALFIGGGIYAYKKYEPMLTGTLSEGKSHDAAENTGAASDTPVAEPKDNTIQEPPLVVKNEPKTTTESALPSTPDESADSEKPTPAEPNRTRKPPKAMVIEEDE